MSNAEHKLQMVWPEHLHTVPHQTPLVSSYSIRTYQSGDEASFYDVMVQSGWQNWNDEVLQRWHQRIFPDGWFMVIHKPSQKIVFSVMALQSNAYTGGGELGWLASDPTHSGQGLGTAISAAVTQRMLHEKCAIIHLSTEDFRLAAIKIYLKLGYCPVLYLPEMQERWQEICSQLNIPYTPEAWKSTVTPIIYE